MSDLLKALKFTAALGEDDSKKFDEITRTLAYPLKFIESQLDTEDALKQLAKMANDGFNLVYRNREAFDKFGAIKADELMKSFHSAELLYEAELED